MNIILPFDTAAKDNVEGLALGQLTSAHWAIPSYLNVIYKIFPLQLCIRLQWRLLLHQQVGHGACPVVVSAEGQGGGPHWCYLALAASPR